MAKERITEKDLVETKVCLWSLGCGGGVHIFKLQWGGVWCPHTWSPEQIWNTAPQKPASAIWGRLDPECPAPPESSALVWKSELETTERISCFEIQFYEMIGSQPGCCKTAQVETKTSRLLLNLSRLPGLFRFRVFFSHILVTWHIGNREATWNLRSHWNEFVLLPLLHTLQASFRLRHPTQTVSVADCVWRVIGFTTWTRGSGWRPVGRHSQVHNISWEPPTY